MEMTMLDATAPLPGNELASGRAAAGQPPVPPATGRPGFIDCHATIGSAV